LNTLLWFGSGVAAGGGCVGVVWILYRRWALPRRPSHAPSIETLEGTATPPDFVDAAPPNGSPPTHSIEDSFASGSVEMDQTPLSERIVVQLARQGRIEFEAPVRPTRTQQGLADALASNQSAVSKVLRRLEAADIVTGERRHIVGSGQRKKAYALTRRGELLAREVAHRRQVDLLPPRDPWTPAVRRAPSPPSADSPRP
jgi:DNA-binding MarR family transcriptional regulator